jgi:hypothetical protein
MGTCQGTDFSKLLQAVLRQRRHVGGDALADSVSKDLHRRRGGEGAQRGHAKGKYEEALALHTKSLEIRTRIYGVDSHPDVA